MSDRGRGRLLVGAQFVLIGIIAIGRGSRLWPNWSLLIALEIALFAAGSVILILAFFHLGSALTANPVPRSDASLHTNGVYAYVRHPIYTGVLLTGMAVAIHHASLISVSAFLALVVLLNFKARWEEVFLLAKHRGYLSYMEQVPRFLPWPRANRDLHEH